MTQRSPHGPVATATDDAKDLLVTANFTILRRGLTGDAESEQVLTDLTAIRHACDLLEMRVLGSAE